MTLVQDMGLSAIEAEIEKIYRWFHTRVPGVTPKEIGRLSDLWRRADYMIWKDGES